MYIVRKGLGKRWCGVVSSKYKEGNADQRVAKMTV